MRKLMLLLLAAFVFASCDNLKTKDSSKSEEDTEETTKKKKKKALDEDEESTEEEPTTKKKRSSDTESSDEETSSDDETTDYETGWSKADQKKFVSNCTQTASAAMGEEKAEEYCTCMLKKIEKRYPNSADVNQLSESEIDRLAKTCLQ